MRELEQRRANQRAAHAVDLADLVLTELRARQQPVLEDRRHHAFPDPANAVAAAISRGRRVRRWSGLGFHRPPAISEYRPQMLVDELYPMTGETLYNL